MPRGATPSWFFRNRSGAAALVIGGHIALLGLLTQTSQRGSETADDERMSLVFIDLPDEHPEQTATRIAPSARSQRTRTKQTPTVAPANVDTTAISPGATDWYAEAGRAAAREATAPELRSFDFPKREPAPREKEEFGWDKVHTERVRALPGGGIGIRLSDNCEIALLPLPIGGCALGKRKARGDLFDEMKAPVELGDWK